MIARYYGEDVRPCGDVWDNKSPVTGDRTRSNGIVEDDFCVSELNGVGTVPVPLDKARYLSSETGGACASELS